MQSFLQTVVTTADLKNENNCEVTIRMIRLNPLGLTCRSLDFETVLSAVYVLLHDAVFFHLVVHLLTQNGKFHCAYQVKGVAPEKETGLCPAF